MRETGLKLNKTRVGSITAISTLSKQHLRAALGVCGDPSEIDNSFMQGGI